MENRSNLSKLAPQATKSSGKRPRKGHGFARNHHATSPCTARGRRPEPATVLVPCFINNLGVLRGVCFTGLRHHLYGSPRPRSSTNFSPTNQPPNTTTPEMLQGLFRCLGGGITRGCLGGALAGWRWHHSRRRGDCSRVLTACIQATSLKGAQWEAGGLL